MNTTPPLIPLGGLYAHTSDGSAAWLSPDMHLTLCCPGAHADEPSTVIELPPHAMTALLEFIDRAGLVRLLEPLPQA